MTLATCTTRSKEMPRGARGREQRSRELSGEFLTSEVKNFGWQLGFRMPKCPWWQSEWA